MTYFINRLFPSKNILLLGSDNPSYVKLMQHLDLKKHQIQATELILVFLCLAFCVFLTKTIICRILVIARIIYTVYIVNGTHFIYLVRPWWTSYLKTNQPLSNRFSIIDHRIASIYLLPHVGSLVPIF